VPFFRISLFLFFAAPLYGAPRITEFLASNASGLKDEDGAYSDWIEIHNPDVTPIDLAGWHLTDDSTDLNKWTFPSVSIPAGKHLVVFASNKNRTLTTPHHTNFKLSASGEYLALVSPSLTVTSEFTFPQQTADVSFGPTKTGNDFAFVSESALARAHVPDLAYESAVGTTWRDNDSNFNVSGWLSGNLGVGLERSSGFQNEFDIDVLDTSWNVNASVYIRIPFSLDLDQDEIETLTLRMKFDDGFAAFLNGTYVAGGNAPSPLAWNSNATASNPDIQALQFQDFDITDHIDKLVAGDNLLAIHGLNRFSISGDFLIRPELVATLTRPVPPVIGYFSTPTPRTENPTTNTPPPTLEPSAKITLSEESGVKISAITLSLSSENPGEIRYTLDGSDPNETSRLYTTALTISNPTKLRARAYEPDKTAGPVAVGDYAFLDSSLLGYLSEIPVIVMDNFGAGNYPNKGRSNDGHDVKQVPRQGNVLSIFDAATGHPFTSHPILESRTGCRVRGSSSSQFTRKPLSVEFWKDDDSDRNLSPFGMESEADWVLYPPNPNFDRALIHNSIAFGFAKMIGARAPESQLVAVFQNTNGGKVTSSDLAGLFLLIEKIERNRVGLDFKKLDDTGTDGGWMVNIDRMEAIPEDLPANTTQPNFHAAGPNGILQIPDDQQNSGGSQSVDDISEFYHSYLNFNSPNGYRVLPIQRSEIQSRVRAMDSSVWAANANDPVNGYRAHLDTDSWARAFAVHNFAINQDAHVLSTFIYQETPTAKIKMGPIWDFDRAFTWKGSATQSPLWASNRDWYAGLFDDPDFQQAHQDIWQEARVSNITNSALETLVDDSAIGPRSDQVSASGLSFSTWQSRVKATKSWIVNRSNYLDRRYESLPTVSPTENLFVNNVTVTMSPTAGGIVYHTTDGSDPRLDGGAISPSAMAYTSPLNINSRTRLITRTKDGSRWSGRVERTYYQTSKLPQLVISEINYHPADPSPSEIAAGFDNSDDFEFFEIENIGNTPADLNSLAVSGGIEFEFSSGTIPTLASGQRVLVVRNQAAFELRYGNVHPVSGEYSGALNNAGDIINLKDTLLELILQSATYSDSHPWPLCADGEGYSLILKLPESNPDHNLPSNWRCSTGVHGNPGASDAQPIFSGDPSDDDDNDDLTSLLEYTLGTSDTNSSEGHGRYRIGAPITFDGQNYPFVEITYRIGHDDLSLSACRSQDLKTWTDSPSDLVIVSDQPNGDGTATRIWRSSLPLTVTPQFFRIKVTRLLSP
jgi:hypothetical protein|tara:strand:- start:4924 stop:8706 length:3783 start_codon:yes stop_codon:yes gene_type:complete